MILLNPHQHFYHVARCLLLLSWFQCFHCMRTTDTESSDLQEFVPSSPHFAAVCEWIHSSFLLCWFRLWYNLQVTDISNRICCPFISKQQRKLEVFFCINSSSDSSNVWCLLPPRFYVRRIQTENRRGWCLFVSLHWTVMMMMIKMTEWILLLGAC